MSQQTSEVIAHRGYSAQAPENTLPAFRAALQAGADGLEWDIQFSRDEVPVVFHDDRLERRTEAEGLVKKHSWEEISQLDAGRWFGEEFAGTRIPRLSEVLELVQGQDIALYPELKAIPSREALQQIVRLLKLAGLASQTTIISCHQKVVAQALRLSPDLRGGYVVDDLESTVYSLERAHQHPRTLVDAKAEVWLEHPHLVERARDLGVEVATWTVNDPEHARSLLEIGVGRLTTNEVELIQEVVRAPVKL